MRRRRETVLLLIKMRLGRRLQITTGPRQAIQSKMDLQAAGFTQCNAYNLSIPINLKIEWQLQAATCRQLATLPRTSEILVVRPTITKLLLLNKHYLFFLKSCVLGSYLPTAACCW
jgi:hypothetical protein